MHFAPPIFRRRSLATGEYAARQGACHKAPVRGILEVERGAASFFCRPPRTATVLPASGRRDPSASRTRTRFLKKASRSHERARLLAGFAATTSSPSPCLARSFGRPDCLAELKGVCCSPYIRSISHENRLLSGDSPRAGPQATSVVKCPQADRLRGFCSQAGLQRPLISFREPAPEAARGLQAVSLGPSENPAGNGRGTGCGPSRASLG